MVVQAFHVAGMTCEHCVRAVTDEVAKLVGVEAVHVDLASGAITVTADRTLDDREVAAAVDEAGYELVPA
jgi:copper chaperone CopZ